MEWPQHATTGARLPGLGYGAGRAAGCWPGRPPSYEEVAVPCRAQK